MPLPGIRTKSQTEKVAQELAEVPRVTTERLTPPGINTLHTRTYQEISDVLANLLKSKPGISSFTFVVGSHVEITYLSNPLGQLR